MKIYIYDKCDTCRKALKFLAEKGVAFEKIPIRETPPSSAELRQMLAIVGMKRLFNTSGGDYKAMNLKDQLPSMSEAEAIALLAKNGNLVKRPFLLTPDGKGTTGFNADEWGRLLGK